ncbi:hypothetical protein ABEP16_12350 [Priestia aryabhattai]|uniref:hypothetical protein n=1 Tax=Priestia aryabhattai TaxID=412384 RepID=UPI003D2C84DE
MRKSKEYEIELEFLPSKIKKTKEEQEAIRRKSVSILIDSLILNGVIDLSQLSNIDEEEKRPRLIL